MKHPPTFVAQDRRFMDRREVRIGGGVVIVILLVLAVRAMRGGRHADTAPVAPVAAETRPTPPPAPPAPPPPQPAAAPAPPTAPSPPAEPAKVAEAESPQPAQADPKVDDSKANADEKPAAADEPKEEATQPAPKAKVSVLIKSDPEGTRVTAGKRVFGTTPVTVKLRPGNSYELTFTKIGYVTLSRRYKADGEAPQMLRVTLKKAPEPPKKPAQPPSPPPVVKGPPPVPPHKGFFTR
jgi:hypothetical protein